MFLKTCYICHLQVHFNASLCCNRTEQKWKYPQSLIRSKYTDKASWYKAIVLSMDTNKDEKKGSVEYILLKAFLGSSWQWYWRSIIWWALFRASLMFYWPLATQGYSFMYQALLLILDHIETGENIWWKRKYHSKLFMQYYERQEQAFKAKRLNWSWFFGKRSLR